MYFSFLSSTNHRRPIYRASGMAQYFIAYCVVVRCRWGPELTFPRHRRPRGAPVSNRPVEALVEDTRRLRNASATPPQRLCFVNRLTFVSLVNDSTQFDACQESLRQVADKMPEWLKVEPNQLRGFSRRSLAAVFGAAVARQPDVALPDLW